MAVIHLDEDETVVSPYYATVLRLTPGLSPKKGLLPKKKPTPYIPDPRQTRAATRITELSSGISDSYRDAIARIHNSIQRNFFESPVLIGTKEKAGEVKPIPGSMVIPVRNGSHNYLKGKPVIVGYYDGHAHPYAGLDYNGSRGNYLDGEWRYATLKEVDDFFGHVPEDRIEALFKDLTARGVQL